MIGAAGVHLTANKRVQSLLSRQRQTTASGRRRLFTKLLADFKRPASRKAACRINMANRRHQFQVLAAQARMSQPWSTTGRVGSLPDIHRTTIKCKHVDAASENTMPSRGSRNQPRPSENNLAMQPASTIKSSPQWAPVRTRDSHLIGSGLVISDSAIDLQP